ncbi:hypothetical protein M0R45_007826 [Rubus argutus]|uniref:Uncharacterized protein n=1 Tax=Rubus argutus TaxID=59490 RepID=A0AAW1Y0B0_RUBAR
MRFRARARDAAQVVSKCGESRLGEMIQAAAREDRSGERRRLMDLNCRWRWQSERRSVDRLIEVAGDQKWEVGAGGDLGAGLGKADGDGGRAGLQQQW